MNANVIPVSLPALDRINRHAYQRRGVLRQYRSAVGWLEPGEQKAIEHIAEASRGKAILDIGVGGGRTAPMLREISSDYRGIDYTPAMVEIARQRFPDIAFLEMDARKLAFADETFGLVVFSYNGIDSVDLDGRLSVLREAYRTLTPGGYFVFSALNRRGASIASHWPDWDVFRGAGHSPTRLLRAYARLAVGGLNRLRRSRIRREADDMIVGQIAAHNFALVTLFLSLREQLRELRVVGFVVEAVYQHDGAAVATDGSGETDAPWYYYVARRP